MFYQLPPIDRLGLATEAGQQNFMENHLMDRCMKYAEGATSKAVSLTAELHA
jgi:hypothetical protein